MWHSGCLDSVWNCLSVVNNPEFMSAFTADMKKSLDFLALMETRIPPREHCYSSCSLFYVFSYSLRASGRHGEVTGLLISPERRCSLFSPTHLSSSSFQFHAVIVTCPLKINIIVIYRAPGALGEILNELDTLISSFTDDGSALFILGDFNLPTSALD